MRVAIARQGQVLVPGCCYIGRPDWPLTLLGDRSAFLVDGTKERLRNWTVDALLGSVEKPDRRCAFRVDGSEHRKENSRHRFIGISRWWLPWPRSDTCCWWF